ncbi:MAG: endonuclease [Roseibacillus sp.]|jgi:endonuclease/exonuclease/phosphatase family metal-dependent hydrolase|nr:endonuclease [Roseibacillus sp.]MBP34200.1 endonuclease [Roseibacillus sp.]MCP4730470.1 endonuclease/exonuclease/phosphatase family protein [Roseibacillus sp.]MDP7308650.1 endonuclease/exonuclease/phosphatase family protein [Roseibacillus sp.]MDP7654511.1 endonuclease/exonuclease/phosphatase family protein [Roseibacillus sp.]|tara:strand:+ start:1948 stop:2796 length:849 start_codon:yes stop_codon:yes gene_type:complete
MARIIALLILLLPRLWAADAPLNIITYNIRNDNAGDRKHKDWAARKDRIAGYLLAHKAGIIGLQEVKHNQLLDMDKALPGHSCIGVGRNDGKTAGEYSPIFFDRTIWKVDPKEQGTFWLSDTPDVVATRSWGNSHNRICTWARLTGIKGADKGISIYVFNTHWDHRSQPSRVKSGELMLKRIKARQHRDEPVILMGDLNATTENPAVKLLLGSGLLVDHSREQKRSSSYWKAELAPGLRIDHLFTSPSIKQATLKVELNGDDDGHAASDHHPVRLSIKNRSF